MKLIGPAFSYFGAHNHLVLYSNTYIPVKTEEALLQYVTSLLRMIAFWNVLKLDETQTNGYAADRFTTVHMHNIGNTFGSALRSDLCEPNQYIMMRLLVVHSTICFQLRAMLRQCNKIN